MANLHKPLISQPKIRMIRGIGNFACKRFGKLNADGKQGLYFILSWHYNCVGRSGGREG